MSEQKATFGAGCFGGVEEQFRRLDGVTTTRVGYAGGSVDKPNYEAVCTDRTGHAEVVEVTFDPAVISYGELLTVFWDIHDPTQLNRQGFDEGSQYHTVIFTHSDTHATEAQQSLNTAQEGFSRPIVTQILPAPTFWEAEEYHQKYLLKRGAGSCGF